MILVSVFQWRGRIIFLSWGKIRSHKKGESEKILLCKTEEANEKALKNDNISFRYEIARGRQTQNCQTGDKCAVALSY